MSTESLTTADAAVGDLADAERRLASVAPGYLERVRRAATRLAARETVGDTRAAMEAVEELSVVDLDVPTASRMRGARLLKSAVKRLIAWYLGYFGRQLSAFGQAVTNLASILLEHAERNEAATASLRADVAGLAERVERLEDLERGGR